MRRQRSHDDTFVAVRAPWWRAVILRQCTCKQGGQLQPHSRPHRILCNVPFPLFC